MITGTSNEFRFFSCNMQNKTHNGIKQTNIKDCQNKTHNGIKQTNIKDCISGIAYLRQLPQMMQTQNFYWSDVNLNYNCHTHVKSLGS